VKNTSTDEGHKPEKVYKQVWRSRRIWWFGWFSGIITSSSVRYWRHPTSGRSWHLYADPRMCMMIIQRATRLTITRQPRGELGGSR
jgi:hypothetical protein